MTDYLEPREAEGGDALLEAVRRAEDLLAGLGAPEEPAGLSQTAEGGESGPRGGEAGEPPRARGAAAAPGREEGQREAAEKTAALGPEDRPAGPAAEENAAPGREDRPAGPAEEKAAAPGPESRPAEESGGRRRTEGAPEGEGAGGLPLLDELELLEEAALSAARLEPSGRRGAAGRRTPYPAGAARRAGLDIQGPDASGGHAGEPWASAGIGSEALARLRADQPSWGEEVLLAEEMDRALRRDSRRYDGGFFLY